MPFQRIEQLLESMPDRQAAKIQGMRPEAQQAALDAYNGCMYDGENPSEQKCIRAAVQAAMSASEGGKRRPDQGRAPAGGGPGGGGRRRGGGGGGRRA